jgi:hypothetical protein
MTSRQRLASSRTSGALPTTGKLERRDRQVTVEFAVRADVLRGAPEGDIACLISKAGHGRGSFGQRRCSRVRAGSWARNVTTQHGLHRFKARDLSCGTRRTLQFHRTSAPHRLGQLV